MESVKEYLQDEEGMGTVEVILIIVERRTKVFGVYYVYKARLPKWHATRTDEGGDRPLFFL